LQHDSWTVNAARKPSASELQKKRQEEEEESCAAAKQKHLVTILVSAF
jgi:hypothetical protein